MASDRPHAHAPASPMPCLRLRCLHARCAMAAIVTGTCMLELSKTSPEFRGEGIREAPRKHLRVVSRGVLQLTKCPEGYVDRTGGLASIRPCGLECPGGQFTLSYCQCACVRSREDVAPGSGIAMQRIADTIVDETDSSPLEIDPRARRLDVEDENNYGTIALIAITCVILIGCLALSVWYRYSIRFRRVCEAILYCCRCCRERQDKEGKRSRISAPSNEPKWLSPVKFKVSFKIEKSTSAPSTFDDSCSLESEGSQSPRLDSRKKRHFKTDSAIPSLLHQVLGADKTTITRFEGSMTARHSEDETTAPQPIRDDTPQPPLYPPSNLQRYLPPMLEPTWSESVPIFDSFSVAMPPSPFTPQTPPCTPPKVWHDAETSDFIRPPSPCSPKCPSTQPALLPKVAEKGQKKRSRKHRVAPALPPFPMTMPVSPNRRVRRKSTFALAAAVSNLFRRASSHSASTVSLVTLH